MKVLKVAVVTAFFLLAAFLVSGGDWTRPPTLERAYGEMAIDNNSNATPISGIDVWANVTNFTSLPEENKNFGFEDNGVLVSQVSGQYLAMHSESISNGNNVDYNINIAVNDVPHQHCIANRKIGAGGDVGDSGGNCILRLEVGDRVSLQLINRDNTNSIMVEEGSVVLLRIDD